MAHRSPCDKNCPDRDSECHATCERYLEYVKENEKRREEEHKAAIYAAYVKHKGRGGLK